MKAIIDRVFPKRAVRPAPAQPVPSAVSSELTHGDLEQYYLRIVTDCLRRMLVPADSIEVGVRRAGTGPGGLTAFAAYVRVLRWDALITPVVLQNAPVIDARIRKVAAASSILQHTHFEGLWFQATRDTAGAPQALVGMPGSLPHPAGGAG